MDTDFAGTWERMKYDARQAGIAGQALAPGALAGILPPGPKPVSVPDGVQAPGAVEQYIPGAVSGTYAFFDTLGNLASQAVRGSDLHLPGGMRAGELASMSLSNAKEQTDKLPHIQVDPNNPDDEFSDATGTAVGGMLLGKKGPTGLGRVVDAAKGVMFPGSHMGAVGRVMGPTVASAGLEAADAALEARDTGKSFTEVEGERRGGPAGTQVAPPKTGTEPERIELPKQVAGTTPNPFTDKAGTANATMPASGGPEPIDLPPREMSNYDKVSWWADKVGVPQALAHSIVPQESGYRSDALNKETGAAGVMQLMPGTAKMLGVSDPMNPDQAIPAGLRYLKQGMDEHGTVEGAARFYYGGPSTAQWGPNTQHYADVIAARYKANVANGMSASPTTSAVADGPQRIELPEQITLPPRPTVTGSEFTDALLTVGAGAAALKFGGSAMRYMGRLTGLSREARYNAAARDFNTDRADRLAGGQSITAPTPASPLPPEGAGNKIAAAVQDQTRPLQQYLDLVADGNQSMSEAMRSRLMQDTQFTALNQRVGAVMRDGHDYTTGMDLPSAVELENRYNALTPEQQVKFDGRWAAKDEQDNRVHNMRVNRTMVDREQAVNMPFDDNAKLRDAARPDDPVVDNLLQDYHVLMRRIPEVLARHDFITVGDAIKTQNEHPHYMPSYDASGKIMHPFAARDYTPGSGAEKMNVRAVDLVNQHILEVFKATYRNDFKQEFRRSVYDAQTRPEFAKMLEPHQGPPADANPGAWIEEARRNNVMITRVNGQLVYDKVLNPKIYNLIERTEPVARDAVTKAANTVKNWVSSGSVGARSMLLGNPFGITHAIRSNVQSSVGRSGQLSQGFGDAFVRWMSGGRFGIRGDVVGTALGQAHAISTELVTLGARRMATLLHKDSEFWPNRALRTIAGDGIVDAARARMALSWKESVLAKMEQEGVRGSIGLGSRELPVNKEGASLQELYSPHHAMVEHDVTDIPFVGQGQRMLLNFKDLYHTLHEVIAESASSHHYRLNTGNIPGARFLRARGVNPEFILQEVRDLQGDIGKRPGQVMQSVNDVTPFMNATIQGSARYMRSWRETPMSTLVGHINAVGLPVAASLYLALLTGPDAIKHMFEEQSYDQQVRYVTFPIPGLRPEQYPRIELPQELRPFNAVARELWRTVFGIDTAFNDPQQHDWATNVIGRMLEPWITHHFAESMLAGVSSVIQPPIPPMIDVPLRVLGGKELQPDMMRALTSPNQSASGAIDSLTMPTTGGDPGMPNTVKGADSATSTTEGNIAMQLLAALHGTMGQLMAEAMGVGADTFRREGDWVGALANVKDWWKQTAANRLPGGNMLWGTDAKLYRGTPTSEVVSNYMQATKPMVSAMGDVMGEGMTRTDGQVLENPSATTKVPTDPAMRELWFNVGTAMGPVREYMMAPIHDIEKQMYNNEHSGKSVYEVRSRHNELVRERSDKLDTVLSRLREIDEGLSEKFGAHIRMTNIDWSRGMEQFRRSPQLAQ